ncbi:MAG: PAS-domain containing protein [Hyphomicrobiaceae bacterium]
MLQAFQRFASVPSGGMARRAGQAMALLIALLIPASYAVVGYVKAVDALDFKVELSAERAAEFVLAHPKDWRYLPSHALAAIGVRSPKAAPIAQSLYDHTGDLVATTRSVIQGPAITRRAPIVVAGAVVGSAVATSSLHGLLIETLFITFAVLVAAAAAFVMFAAAPLRLLDASAEKLRRQNNLLDAAMENMLHGVAMFDADHRLVVCNKLYAQMYGLTPEQVKPGTLAQQIFRCRLANGHYETDDKDGFVESWIGDFGTVSTRIQQLADGRIISVSRCQTADGGRVVTHEDITERQRLNAQIELQNDLLKAQEEKLRQQYDRLDAAMENMPLGIAMFDAGQRLVVCNRLYAEMYGLSAAQCAPGTTVREILNSRIAAGCYATDDPQRLIGTLLANFGNISSETQELADGRVIKVASRRMANGGFLITHEDTTERARLTAEVAERSAILQAIIDNFPGGISYLDGDLRMKVANTRMRELLDFPDELFADGMPTLEEVFRFNARRGEYGAGDPEEQVSARMALARKRIAHQFERERPDGTVIEVRGLPLASGGFVTTYMDVTERRRSEARIVHMALHDTMTGLANRTHLGDRLEQALARAQRGEMIAVHLIDLDHFKNVNDTLGHHAGDTLIRMVAERLSALVRETDTVGRMGGDEFAVVQTGISHPADATRLADRIIAEVAAPYEIDGHNAVIGTSIGIAVGPDDGLTPELLMRNADLALYRAKGRGRNGYCFFESGMDAQMRERRALECDMRRALVAGEFELFYQPIVTLKDDRVSGFEALIRWNHPVRGMIVPSEFIPLAEEIGFIVPLGEWVIRQACATAARWPGDLKIAVNLSPAQFRSSGLAHVVLGALASSGLPASRLEIEITETALLGASDAAVAILNQLRDIGVRIAMDDFGTGFSSLSHLKTFPFDKIKIDRSFVMDVTEGTGSLNIVRAVASLGIGLGMETTAEGVETQEQLDAVRSEGCTEMQGYLFSKPLPIAEVERLIAGLGLPPVHGQREENATPARAIDAA